MEMNLEISNIQKFLSQKSRASVILYAQTIPRVLTYVPLYQALLKEGCVCVLVIPQEIDSKDVEMLGVSKQAIYNGSRAEISQLKHVDIFFGPESTNIAPPPGAVSIAIYHSLPDQEGFSADYRKMFTIKPTIVGRFDYIVIGSRQDPDKWQSDGYLNSSDGVFPRKLLAHRREAIDIVPGGYPKLDHMKEVFSDWEGKQDCIIYCPTNSEVDYSQVLNSGTEVIERLLRCCPDHDIVFRPYPGDSQALNIAANFRNKKRFVIDSTLFGLEYQKRAAAVVTDRSSSAITFSLASGRPSIFSNFNGNRADKRDNPKATQITEEQVGLRVKHMDDIENALWDTLSNSSYWKEKIEQSARLMLYNPGESSEYIASRVETFLERRSDADFLSIERRSWEEVANASPRQHLENLRGTWSHRNVWQKEAIRLMANCFRSEGYDV